MNDQEINQKIVESEIDHKLFESVTSYLGREPNFLELKIYSIMWSEAVSYKSSYKLIKSLPDKGDAIIIRARERSAGAVDLGNGLCCVFKMKTRNYLSRVDPYEGATTCVDDVCRDIISLGAKPITILSALRFGTDGLDRTHWLMTEMFKGINNYSRFLDIPSQGGELYFHSTFDKNPIVNVLTAGVLPKKELLWKKRIESGQLIYLVGSLTGKDGTSAESEKFTIPKCDHVLAKILMDTVLKLNKKGMLVRAENMDVAGIVNACAIIGADSKMGIQINLDKVPLKEDEITAEEILLSRTQERMMLVVDKINVSYVEKILQKSQLFFAQIGKLEDGNMLRIFQKENCIAELPSAGLVMGFGASETNINTNHKNEEINLNSLPEPDDYWKVIRKMSNNPNIMIKESIQIKEEKRQSSLSDSQIVHLDGKDEMLCFDVSGNSAYTLNNQDIVSQINVAKSIRRIICSGGTPLALNNCLNYGNPFKEETYSQFADSIKGITKASNFFGTPVVGGNVSFFNESSVLGKRRDIHPTSIIGMMGLIKKKENHMSYVFCNKGDMIFLIGKSKNDIAGSEYLSSIYEKQDAGTPYFNLEEEKKINETTSKLINRKLICSAHSVGRGGLFFNLLESSMLPNLGFDITSPAEIRKDAFLFGEAQGRIVVSVSMKNENKFIDFMIKTKVPFSALGHVTKGELRIDDISFGFVKEYKEKYNKIKITI